MSGTDHRGTFSNGTTGRDLSGLAFFQSVTFDPTLVINEVSVADYTFISGELHSGAATTTITIDKVSHSFTWDASKSIYVQVA